MTLYFATAALFFCLLGSGLLLMLSFVLLPWARKRLGNWALALIPASTFGGAYFGWILAMLFVAN